MTTCLRVFLVAVFLGLVATFSAAADDSVLIGTARVDITPDGPIRLAGYASRKTESEGVAQRLWVKALAIGADSGSGPCVLMMVENCGVPGSLTAEVADRLQAKARVAPERFVVCSTHIHSGPWLPGFAPNLSQGALPAEHQKHLDQYRRQLADKMEQAALAALAARQPGRLSWGEGSVGFAMNRRPIDKNGKCPGLGVNPAGPVDRSLPVLCARDLQGKLLAIVVNYACHCTTLGGDFNRIHGDWAGMAQQYIEAEHPGTLAMITIGCGADTNPEPRGKLEMTALHGRAVADEVARLLCGKLAPIAAPPSAGRIAFTLPLETPPTRQQLEATLAALHKAKVTPLEKRHAERAKSALADSERAHRLPAAIDYSATVWSFGSDLAMVFLPGEVVVDYALRLKRELDGARLWVTAYSNDIPCYIVSRRVLAEGGYEPDFSMNYYGWPTNLSPAAEERIIAAVKSLVPQSFVAPAAKPAAY